MEFTLSKFECGRDDKKNLYFVIQGLEITL